MKSTREANKCTGKIFRGRIFDNGMADVLRTLVVLLLCALCLGSCAREGDKDYGLQVTGYGDNGEGLTVNGSYLAGSDDRQSRAGLMVHGSEDESSTVSRRMQESTETVAKTYGYFSENGGSEKNQNRSSVSGVQKSAISHQTSIISHLTSTISHLTSTLSHQTSTLSHLTSIISHLTSTISHLTRCRLLQWPLIRKNPKLK